MMEERIRSFLYKIWSILMPLVIYYAVYMMSFFLLSYCYNIMAVKSGIETASFLQEQKITLTGIVNGISMLLGALVLVPLLRAELREHRNRAVLYRQRNFFVQNGLARSDAVQKKRVQAGSMEYTRDKEKPAVRMTGMVFLTVGLAAASSVGLNILLTLTGFAQSSSGYQEVAQAQYGVVLWVGLILYTVISPVAEETVFRGIIYNRMRRYLGEWLMQKTGRFDTAATVAAIASGVLFGVYHGNPVQGVYGGCMGILMAYMYERTHAFYIPCVFHAAANCVVYLAAQNAVLHERIFTLPCCVVLLGISTVLILAVEKTAGKDKAHTVRKET